VWSMKALTIIQPFAHLIATGEKRVENRTWPTGYRGPLAIHAGKARRYDGEPVSEIARYYDIDPRVLVLGAVLATAELVACVQIQPPSVFERAAREDSILALDPKFHWMIQHRHAEGPWCWVLESVQLLPSPVITNGSLGLWEWEPTEARI
jgi:activating signal cointegrator 1